MSFFNFTLGWFIVFGGVWLGLKYEGSRTVIYYVAWLLVVLNIAAHHTEFENILGNAGLAESDTVGAVTKANNSGTNVGTALPNS